VGVCGAFVVILICGRVSVKVFVGITEHFLFILRDDLEICQKRRRQHNLIPAVGTKEFRKIAASCHDEKNPPGGKANCY
jgi:hypothetical protein